MQLSSKEFFDHAFWFSLRDEGVIWCPSGLSFCARLSSDTWHLVGSLAYQISWETSKKSLNYLYLLMIPFRLLGGLNWDLGYSLRTNLRFAHYSFHSWSLQVNVDPIYRSKSKYSTWDSCSVKKKKKQDCRFCPPRCIRWSTFFFFNLIKKLQNSVMFQWGGLVWYFSSLEVFQMCGNRT